MIPNHLLNPIKELFISHGFEVCEESVDEENLNMVFIKKDFRIEAYCDASDNSFDLSLDRPSFGFNDSKTVKDLSEILNMSKDFIQK